MQMNGVNKRASLFQKKANERKNRTNTGCCNDENQLTNTHTQKLNHRAKKLES